MFASIGKPGGGGGTGGGGAACITPVHKAKVKTIKFLRVIFFILFLNLIKCLRLL
jgi:hypothetical protein